MIAENFNEWVECITKKCKIKLDSTYAKERIEVLSNENHLETKKFEELYGKEHLENVIHWFQQIV